MYSIDLRAVVTGLWKQLLGSLLFCLFQLTHNLAGDAPRRSAFHHSVDPSHPGVDRKRNLRRVIRSATPSGRLMLRHRRHRWYWKTPWPQQWHWVTGRRREALHCRLDRGEAFANGRFERSDYFETIDGRHLYLSAVHRPFTKAKTCCFAPSVTSVRAEASRGGAGRERGNRRTQRGKNPVPGDHEQNPYAVWRARHPGTAGAHATGCTAKDLQASNNRRLAATDLRYCWTYRRSRPAVGAGDGRVLAAGPCA